MMVERSGGAVRKDTGEGRNCKKVSAVKMRGVSVAFPSYFAVTCEEKLLFH